MAERFDLIVIGTGVAANAVASRCRKAGRSVAIVDERPFGGTCVLRGCDPKKVLRRAAEVVDAARLLDGKGIEAPELTVVWPALMAFKRGFTDGVPESRARSYAEQGIAAFRGTARFTGETMLEVDGAALEGRHVVIASGAQPVPLNIPGAELLASSDDFLERDCLPRRIVFVGGGYISFEFAHIAAHAGAQVIMLEQAERSLTAFDADLVDLLVERTRELGIDYRSGATVERIEKVGNALRVTADIGGEKAAFECDFAVHGAGRAAALQALALDRGGVEASKKGVVVNEYLQSTSNPAVYAAGDAAATAGPPLTPIASLEGDVVAANLLEGNRAVPDYTGVPSAVFTIPALVRVGLTEAEAKEQGLDFDCRFSDMQTWYSTRRVGESLAAAKVLVERGTERLLGAHVLAPDAAELANLFALAIRNGFVRAQLKDFISAYPSAGSDIGSMV